MILDINKKVVYRVFLEKQQRCEIFVELPIAAIYKGAAHRNIKICCGALHLQITIAIFWATNISVRCTFEIFIRKPQSCSKLKRQK
jgi:hypothetical protein